MYMHIYFLGRYKKELQKYCFLEGKLHDWS